MASTDLANGGRSAPRRTIASADKKTARMEAATAKTTAAPETRRVPLCPSPLTCAISSSESERATTRAMPKSHAWVRPPAAPDIRPRLLVINLSGDKPKVIAEAARVLRRGGRVAVSDVIADPDMDETTRADVAAWTGCVAGALTEAEFRAALADAGFRDIEIRETHRVHEHAAAAIIRARKPLD